MPDHLARPEPAPAVHHGPQQQDGEEPGAPRPAPGGPDPGAGGRAAPGAGRVAAGRPPAARWQRLDHAGRSRGQRVLHPVPGPGGLRPHHLTVHDATAGPAILGLAVLVLVAAARGAAHVLLRRDGPPAARTREARGVQLVLLEVGAGVGLVLYGLFVPAARLLVGAPQVKVFRGGGRAFCHRSPLLARDQRRGLAAATAGEAPVSGQGSRLCARHASPDVGELQGAWGSLTEPGGGAGAEGGGTTGPMSPSGASSRSTITGAWSLGAVPLRAWRSTHAARTRPATASVASTRSIRIPRSRWNIPPR